MKMAVCWLVVLRHLAEVYRRFGGVVAFIITAIALIMEAGSNISEDGHLQTMKFSFAVSRKQTLQHLPSVKFHIHRSLNYFNTAIPLNLNLVQINVSVFFQFFYKNNEIDKVSCCSS
jgi:hypothetical protein